MTEQEEIEYIVNAAYLRGCDSNFKTAIAAMQESEKSRLNSAMVIIHSDSRVTTEVTIVNDSLWRPAVVYGVCDSREAVEVVARELYDSERKRLSELVKMVKEAK